MRGIALLLILDPGFVCDANGDLFVPRHLELLVAAHEYARFCLVRPMLCLAPSATRTETEIKKPVANGMDLSIYAVTDMGYE